MSAASRAELIAELESALDRGTGIVLTADDVRLLTSRQAVIEPIANHQTDLPAAPSIHQPLDVQIRWLCRCDMADVLRIEQQSFEHPWTEEDFLCCLRQRNCIGMVAEYEHEIVGFMIYELHKSRLHILNFAVDYDFRRRSIGSQMVMRLVDKLSPQRRNEILLEVRERNLDGQLFFSKQSFRAVAVLRSHYDNPAEDAIQMRFTIGSECLT